MKIRIEELGEMDAIHCSTEEQCHSLCSLLNSKGYKWESGTSYLEECYWNTHFDQTVYIPFSGTYASRSWCLSFGYRVIPFSEVISPYKIGLVELYPLE